MSSVPAAGAPPAPGAAHHAAGGRTGTSLQFAVFMAVGFSVTLGLIVVVLGAVLIFRCARHQPTLPGGPGRVAQPAWRAQARHAPQSAHPEAGPPRRAAAAPRSAQGRLRGHPPRCGGRQAPVPHRGAARRHAAGGRAGGVLDVAARQADEPDAALAPKPPIQMSADCRGAAGKPPALGLAKDEPPASLAGQAQGTPLRAGLDAGSDLSPQNSWLISVCADKPAGAAPGAS